MIQSIVLRVQLRCYVLVSQELTHSYIVFEKKKKGEEACQSLHFTHVLPETPVFVYRPNPFLVPLAMANIIPVIHHRLYPDPMFPKPTPLHRQTLPSLPHPPPPPPAGYHLVLFSTHA